MKCNLTFKSNDRKEYQYLTSPIENANLKTDMYKKIGLNRCHYAAVLNHSASNSKCFNSSSAYIQERSLPVN